MSTTEELIDAARDVRRHACARWSGFSVGAALLTRQGRIYTGVNVECSSYGGTICAERTALVKALSEGEREFVAIAVATSSPEPVMPCGLCRQLLFDYAPELEVIAVGESRIVRSTMRELLPFGFEGPDTPPQFKSEVVLDTDVSGADYYVYISLCGDVFSPAEVERETGLVLTEKIEVGDPGVRGYREQPVPYGRARLVAPSEVELPHHLLWLLDAALIHIDSWRRLGVEDAEVWKVHNFHGGQANMEYTPEELEKLGRLGLSLCVSCYE